MKAKLFFSLMALCGSLLLAQGPQIATKIVRVKGSAKALYGLACNPSIDCRVSDELHALVLRGESSAVDGVERTIQELDKLSAEVSPPSTAKNVELTTYVIGGSDEPLAGVQEVTGEALTPVIRQLKSIFPYKHYQLLSTMLLRAAPGSKAQTEGIMKGLLNTREISQPSTYQLGVDGMVVSAGKYSSVHLQNFKLNFHIPSLANSGSTTQYRIVNSGLEADLDIQEGQKVVVGKTNISDSDKCLFVVLTARLL